MFTTMKVLCVLWPSKLTSLMQQQKGDGHEFAKTLVSSIWTTLAMAYPNHHILKIVFKLKGLEYY
jgi:hypothetical protein